MQEYTLREAGQLLGLKVDTLRHYVRDGRVHGHQRGRWWFVTAAEVERYQRERRPAHRPRQG